MQLKKLKNFIIILIFHIVCFEMTTSVKLKIGNSEYSRTETPSVITEMFKTIKKANPDESQMYDSCMKEIITTKYEDLLKKFWNRVNSVVCTTQLFKREYFLETISPTIEKIKVENIDMDCRPIVQRNLIGLLEIEGNIIQKRLRDIYGMYFSCDETPVKKSVITAFLGPHRGSAPADLFKNLNSNN
jgi:hypothetical protein